MIADDENNINNSVNQTMQANILLDLFLAITTNFTELQRCSMRSRFSYSQIPLLRKDAYTFLNPNLTHKKGLRVPERITNLLKMLIHIVTDVNTFCARIVWLINN